MRPLPIYLEVKREQQFTKADTMKQFTSPPNFVNTNPAVISPRLDRAHALIHVTEIVRVQVNARISYATTQQSTAC